MFCHFSEKIYIFSLCRSLFESSLFAVNSAVNSLQFLAISLPIKSTVAFVDFRIGFLKQFKVHL